MRRSDGSEASQVPAAPAARLPTEIPGANADPRTGRTLVAAALLEGDAEELLRKAIGITKAGNVPMLKFLLNNSCPRSG